MCSGLLVLATWGFPGTLFFSPGRRFPDLVMARRVDYCDRVDGKTPVPHNDTSQSLLAGK